MEPRVSYLVVGVERSGTTLLCEGLAASGVAGVPEEYFVAWWERTFWLEPWSEDSYTRFLLQILRDGTTPNGVFGAKLLWNHFRNNFEKKLQTIPGKAGLAGHDLLASVLPNLHYMFVRRDDHLRQAISWERAFQTNQWKSEHLETRPLKWAPEFRYPEIKNLVNVIGEQERAWREFFHDADIVPFEIEYEDLARDPDAAVHAALDFLSIAAPPGFRFVPQMKRQADETTEDWIAMYEATQSGIPIVFAPE